MKTTRNAFTMVEILVVIVIIAMLAGLTAGVAIPAIATARRAAVTTEMSMMDGALKAYKAKHGAYPPSFARAANSTEQSQRLQEIKRHMAKAFPQHMETDATLLTLVNKSPDELLVFWLSGFTPDPEYPISGSGDKTPYFEFNKARFKDEDGNGFPSYYPSRIDAPYHYCRFSDYPKHLAAAATVDWPTPFATTLKSDGTVQDWAQDSSFQILAAGLDSEFGDVDANPKLWGQQQTFAAPHQDAWMTMDDDLVNFDNKPHKDSVDD